MQAETKEWVEGCLTKVHERLKRAQKMAQGAMESEPEVQLATSAHGALSD